ncbi:NUDIX domain-containing protein [Nucisporomicrobium flavum]|jgi:8-oxo-dGTP diphosphatase|uniref:NUDIX domain-containing protein n=1 Tax=Nucisporomicrobium flavum TaxID=2785915 RepID=UPI0018F2E618|nr:NUDIX domain-containing protein [Nucisporomicrobium flavum]
MTSALHDLVSVLRPYDDLEAAHRADTLAWLASTDDVYRRVRPDTPPRHLVSYVVPVDPGTGDVLLVDHRNARLWLPPGGHVEPGEDPAATAHRELAEELGVAGAAAEPVFLTVTETVGVDAGHTDVSLWYLATVGRDEPLSADEGEFAAVRWWTRAEIAAADPARFDPHLGRFLAKTAAEGR